MVQEPPESIVTYEAEIADIAQTLLTGHYGYSIGPKGRIVHVGSAAKTLKAANEAMKSDQSRNPDVRAHIYRQVDGYRFVGYLREDGTFADMRVERGG